MCDALVYKFRLQKIAFCDAVGVMLNCLSTSDVPIGQQAGRQPNQVKKAD